MGFLEFSASEMGSEFHRVVLKRICLRKCQQLSCDKKGILSQRKKDVEISSLARTAFLVVDLRKFLYDSIQPPNILNCSFQHVLFRGQGKSIIFLCFRKPPMHFLQSCPNQDSLKDQALTSLGNCRFPTTFPGDFFFS